MNLKGLKTILGLFKNIQKSTRPFVKLNRPGARDLSDDALQQILSLDLEEDKDFIPPNRK